MARRVLAEYLGAMILVAAVVGSGIAATTVTDVVGVQLLMDALATVMVLGLPTKIRRRIEALIAEIAQA